MTLIVSDNSPLNILIRVGQAELLPRLFASVLIPPEVADEMRHPKAPEAVREFIEHPPPWLGIRKPNAYLSFANLDRGESAAISLAVELHALLMVDEREGREVARARGLQVIGAVGVLERAANEGLLDLKAIHDRIRQMRFHVSNAILDASLTRHLAFKALRR